MHFIYRRLVLLLVGVVAIVTGLSSDGRTWEHDLDVKELLTRPGIKLLAVDFYANWCEPCKKAVPRWQRLEKKYQEQGLRVAIVMQPDMGDTQCKNPPWVAQWRPFKVVCDANNALSDAWRVKDLPMGFLWSWQGQLLVEKGHIENIETAVEQYFKEAPRILITTPQAGEGGKPLKNAALLEKVIRTELVRYSKFDVVASDEERRMMREWQKGHQDAAYNENMQCALGGEVPPNSVLKTTVMGDGGSEQLFVELLSMEKGCMVSSSTAPIPKGPDGLQRAVAEAVTTLISQLIGAVRLPGAGGDMAARQPAPPSERQVTAQAVVRPNQYGGPSIQGAQIQSVQPTVTPQSGLEVVGAPESAEVEVRGPNGYSRVGRLPLSLRGLEPGGYSIAVASQGYEGRTYEVRVEGGVISRLEVALAKPGTLVITGGPRGARIDVSGPGGFTASQGMPMTIKGAPEGTYHLTVSMDGFETQQVDVDVYGGRITTKEVFLKRGSSAKSNTSTTTTGSGAGRFSRRGEIVSDSRSQRMWQAVAPSGVKDYDDATLYCKSLSLGGYRDWRLPTIDELRGMVQDCAGTTEGGACKVSDKSGGIHYSAACKGCARKTDGCYRDSASFSGPCAYYWSESTHAEYENMAWSIDFSCGKIQEVGKIKEFSVRCVREPKK